MNNSLIWKEIVDRIFYVYAERTQKDLAAVLGVASDLISGWKKNKSRPSWELLKKVRDEKHVSWEWLLNGKSSNINELIFLHLRNVLDVKDIPAPIGDPFDFLIVTLSSFFRYKGELGEKLLQGPYEKYRYDHAEASNRFAFIAAHPTRIPVSIPDKKKGDHEVRAKSILSEYNTTKLKESGYDNNSFKRGYEIISRVENDYIESNPTYIPLTISQIENMVSQTTENENNNPRAPKSIPAPARRLPMMRMREYPTRGLAAADDSGRSAGPDTDEIGYPVRLPESMAFIPIVGESMSPVLLGGQLAMIDMNREGFERDRGIVIVNILEDRSNPGMPEPVSGTFCKRCERGDGILYFTSINNYPPFSAWEENCRIWPVIGVWFGDKGVTPLED